MKPLVFPADAAERIVRFLDSGESGTIEISVKSGQIMGGKIIASFRCGDPEPIAFANRRIDARTDSVQDSGS